MSYIQKYLKKALLGAFVFAIAIALPISIANNIQPNLAHADTTAQASATSGSTSAGVQAGASNQSTTPAPSVCNGLYAFFSDPVDCTGYVIASFIGTSIIQLASYILTVAGLLFDWVVLNTVLQFGTVVSGSVITAINTAWSAFRDISNIIIIGMFTFIAIATILGIEGYGYKKMLSRVLIVAVLINFSLLFTKIVIDVSNFTAIQFLDAAGASGCAQCAQLSSTASSTASQSSTSAGATTGIAGAFMQYAGAQSFGNTYSALKNIATDPQNGGWYALLYGVVIGLLELAAAVVLFYGAFLLISRALLMIFLMVTSSIAFASYLLPANLQSNYGWSTWWSALLKNAVFAPLLAVLLWVTLTVAQAYNNTSGGSLGALITNPTQSINVAALFGYIVVIGLLFISIKVSSSFASTIGGFNWASAIAASPITQGSRLGGFIGRRFGLGSWAYGQQESNLADAKEARDKAAAARARGDKGAARNFDNIAASKVRSAERYGKVADSKMNLMNTGAAKTLTKAMGITGVGAGQTAKTAESAAATIKRRADEASKLGAKVSPSNEEKSRVRAEAERNIEQQRKGQEATKEAIKKGSEENAAILKELVEKEKSTNTEHQTAEATVKVAEDGRKDLLQKHDSEVKNLTQQIAAEVGAGRDAAAQKTQLEQHNVAHKNLLEEQDNRIKVARQQLGKINQSIETKNFTINKSDGTVVEMSLKDAQAKVEETKKDLSDFNAHTSDLKKKAGEEAVDAYTDSVTKVIGRTQGTILERAAGALTGDNERVAEAATKKLRSKNSNAAKLREAFKEDVKEHEEPKSESGGDTH